MRSLRRLLLILCLAILTLPILYGAAALALGLLPAPHRHPVPGQPTVPVYLISNGWHVWVAMPARAGHDDTDWSAWLAESSLAERLNEGDYVAFGWGDRDFYLNTRRPADLRPDLALAALLGRGPAAMHVMRVPETVLNGSTGAGPDLKTRRLEVDALQYHALGAYIQTSFSPGSSGRPQPLTEPGFGLDDAFFEATGRYSPFRTCNEWIGAGLRAAGLKAGWWTPFPYGLMQGA